MARTAGVDIPRDKRVVVSLTYIFKYIHIYLCLYICFKYLKDRRNVVERHFIRCISPLIYLGQTNK